MAKQTGGGDLNHKVTFGARGALDDGAGNTEGAFEDKFTVRAQFIHLRGGEAVMAARLGGTHTQIIRVRASSETRLVDAEWLLKDARTDDLFNIRDVTPSDDRAWLDFLCESGVAL